MTRRFLSALLGCAALCAAAPALSGAATASRSAGTFEIDGGGFGHGIGMSQYGAAGYAQHGWNYTAILGHYYQGTSLGRAPDATVTVLLNTGAATFSGASAADGHRLSPGRRYGVFAAHGEVSLVSNGRRVLTAPAPLKVTGSALEVAGKGRYAGSLRFYPSSSGGVDTVNAVSLEDYVRGVIAEEMPASWPAQALEAQAVAARTYVLADTPVSPDYDVYSDTRSQMYGGISAETAASNAATAATAGQVVESGGRVIPTYFFSSSGGHTESIQDVWVGTAPDSYLTGVSDPYDDSNDNPYYRWSDQLSMASAAGRLSGLYKGNFLGIKVLTHGTSPRVVSASVLGSHGDSTVSGETLQEDLGTDSTWMSFTSVTAKGTSSSGRDAGASGTTSSPSPVSSTSGSSKSGTSGSGRSGRSGRSGKSGKSATPVASASSSTGGAGIGAAVTRAPRRLVSGMILPARHGASVTVELREAGRWVGIGHARVRANGRYGLRVPAPGLYRTIYRGIAAPSVRVG